MMCSVAPVLCMTCLVWISSVRLSQPSMHHSPGLSVLWQQPHTEQSRSDQFSSRWYLCTQKSPYAFHPIWHLSEVSPILPLKWFQWSDWRWPSLVLSKEDLLALHLSMPLSSSGSMVMSLALLCPQVLSQAPQHFQIFQEAGHMWGLLSP